MKIVSLFVVVQLFTLLFNELLEGCKVKITTKNMNVLPKNMLFLPLCDTLYDTTCDTKNLNHEIPDSKSSL